jgi:HAD superfamily hydrolase (TIGR01509 family)
MDGVIVDSESRHEQAFVDVVREIGYGDRHGLRFSDYVGRTDHELWADFVSRHQPPQSMTELLDMKSRRVIEILLQEKPLFPGLPELVEKAAMKYPLALASGSERIIVDAVLSLRDLRRFFSAIITGSEIKYGKPEPEIFLRAAELLGVPPGTCWVIEDSKPGIAAGLAAGMRVIAITNTHTAAELAHATHVVSSYEEVERLLFAG